MHKKRVVVVALAVFLGTSAVARATLVQTLIVEPELTKTKGFRTTVKARTYDDQGAKAPGATHVTMRFQKGIEINRRAAGVCTVEKLKQTAGHGCKKDAEIGSGYAYADVRPLFADPVRGDLTLFNGPEPKVNNGVATVVILARAKIAANVQAIYAFEGYLTSDPQGPFDLRYDMDASVEPFQGVKVVVTSFQVTVGKRKVIATKVKRRTEGKSRTVTRREEVNYATPPKSCGGKWTFQGEFAYDDGTTLVKRLDLPCKGLTGR